MSGYKEREPAFMKGVDVKITPDEIDRYEIIEVSNPSTSTSWFGTAAAGTSTQAKPLVIINQWADWPRNLLGQVAGSSDMGGSWVVNGKDQFGNTIAETITIGTATNGGTVAGTKVFALVSSGTFTFTTGDLGSGTPSLGCVTVGTSVIFGLPTKIASTADVKMITWINNGTPTTLNGGTIGAYVLTATHGFRGTATTVALTDRYVVWLYPTYDNSSKTRLTYL